MYGTLGSYGILYKEDLSKYRISTVTAPPRCSSDKAGYASGVHKASFRQHVGNDFLSVCVFVRSNDRVAAWLRTRHAVQLVSGSHTPSCEAR